MFQGGCDACAFGDVACHGAVACIVYNLCERTGAVKGILREIGAYVFGFAMFVCLLPWCMWLLAGRPALAGIKLPVLIVFAVLGIGFSLWSIIYMRTVGKGNPFDAYGHELAPRTKHLMTEGPYRLCRNPMMTGMLVYWLGLQLVLWSWKALVLFAVIMVALTFQVRSEEKRLRSDFGEEYEEYVRRTYRFLPISSVTARR